MSEPPPQSAPGQSACKHCLQPIPRGARICTQCHQYQDWRGRLSVSGTVLALLVALLSVATTAIPIIKNALSSSSSRTSVAKPIIEGSAARIVVINRGIEPSLLSSAFLKSGLINGSVRLRPRSTDDSYIPSGAKQIILDVPMRVRAEDARSRVLSIVGKGSSERPSGRLTLYIRESDGSLEFFEFDITAADLAGLLAERFTKCRTAPPANMRDGC
jgi:hypothetical protein